MPSNLQHQVNYRRAKRTRQRGRTILVILIAVVLGIGTLIFFNERSRAAQKAAQAEQQRIEVAKREAEEKAEREAKEKAQRDREAALKAQEEQLDLQSKALKRFDDVAARFNDARKVASGTGRIALSQPVAALQAIHREAAELEAPACLGQGKYALLEAMKQTVDGYIVFMQNPEKMGDALASEHFSAARSSLSRYNELLAACVKL